MFISLPGQQYIVVLEELQLIEKRYVSPGENVVVVLEFEDISLDDKINLFFIA